MYTLSFHRHSCTIVTNFTDKRFSGTNPNRWHVVKVFCRCVKRMNKIVRENIALSFKTKHVRFFLSGKSRTRSSLVFTGKFAVLYRKSVGIMSFPARLHVYCKRFVASNRIFYAFCVPRGVISYVNSTVLPAPRAVPVKLFVICFPECAALS